jgi:DNA adenine methylase
MDMDCKGGGTSESAERLSYPGSKGQAGTWQRIIGQMPPHSVYVEPFLGSGQIFHRKRPAERSILIDREAAVIAKVGAGIRVPAISAICGDAISLLPGLLLMLPSDALIYADPPYPLSTRKGRRYYNHEMSDDQHAALLALLQGAKCCVMVSSYPNDIYGATLQNWRCLRYPTRTRGRTVTECLWCNFPEPTRLHDPSYTGRNYRERLYLRRLAARWLARLEGMAERKRSFLLRAIVDRYAPVAALPPVVSPGTALRDPI